MRNAFIEELVALARVHQNIALIVGDLGYSVVERFADEFPDRFINAGVAEQNMTGLAAGMASEGYHVFTYSIANFPTFRCAEQIRNDIAYHKLPVTVVSVGGGLAYGNLGYSHHAVQDYGLIRSMPNMLIASPGDPLEVRACMKYLASNPQPSYLRLGKAGEVTFHETIPSVEPGRWLCLKKSRNNNREAILTTGAALQFVLGQIIKKECDERAIYSLPLWSMKDKDGQEKNFTSIDRLTTVEDHLIDCGFGSWLLEALTKKGDLRSRIETVGLSDIVCGTVGSQEVLNKLGGIYNF